MASLKIPKTVSIYPVLIYEDELASEINQDNFFSELLKNLNAF